jgi:outer membrane lipoprotein SlyB
MSTRIAAGLLSLAALAPFAFAPGLAVAQPYATPVADPRIDGFDVEPVIRSAPGSELAFTLYGSPGGKAVVQIAGATGELTLSETESGVYEGTYTIRSRDRITAASRTTANLRVGNRVASAVLDEPVIGPAASSNAASPPAPRPAAGAPRIDHFDTDAPPRLVAGEEMYLTLNGTPGGTASATITGVKGKVLMNETRPGVYEGTYVIKSRDRITSASNVVATLRVGNRESSTVPGQASQSGTSPRAAARPVAKVCANCGAVQAINLIEVKGEGTYLGKIGGGIAGALIGSQIGGGKGTTIAEIAGAAGGVFAGNEIEKRMKTTKHYEAVVHLDNGGTQTFSYPALPGFAVGARVRVENGTLVVQ